MQTLLAEYACDIVISDDGLQHYPLQRDIEIAVIDATRGLGNGHCLPVGPLREPPKRLNTVDFVMLNGITEPIPPGYHCMQLAVDGWYGVSDNHSVSAEEFKQISDSASGKIHAIAGIGNPQRFYSSLQAMQLEVQEHSFADHYQYCSADFEFVEGSLILMTEKDAVKCRDIVPNNSYYLKVSAILEPQFIEQLCTKLSNIKAPQEK
jgi:tetraacyldisaccharide 4'-kinase